MTPTAMILTDKGDDGDAEKSDVFVAINCITHLRKDNFETTWEMAQCSITMLKKLFTKVDGRQLES